MDDILTESTDPAQGIRSFDRSFILAPASEGSRYVFLSSLCSHTLLTIL